MTGSWCFLQISFFEQHMISTLHIYKCVFLLLSSASHMHVALLQHERFLNCEPLQPPNVT